MREILGQLNTLVSSRRRSQILLLALLTIFTASVQVAAIMAIFPFLSLVIQPTNGSSISLVTRLMDWLNVVDVQVFTVWLGIAIVALLGLGSALGAAQIWLVERVAWRTSHEIAVNLLARYLAQEYSWHLAKHTAAISATVLTELQELVRGVIVPMGHILTKGVVALGIVIALVVWDPLFALVVLLTFGFVYLILYVSIRNIVTRIGTEKVVANKQRYRIVNETLGGIREIKLLNASPVFVSEFAAVSKRHADRVADSHVISQSPRFAIEFIALGSVVSYVTYLISTGAPVTQLVPTIGLYAFAGFRLMPNLQQIFAALTRIRVERAVLSRIHAEWRDVGSGETLGQENQVEVSKVKLRNEFRLENVAYSYPGAELSPAVEEISLSVHRGESIALIGPSGGGKSTILDLITGLLIPQRGTVLVDGEVVRGDTGWEWNAEIGYVSQNLYLTDNSVAANIAFGSVRGDINMESVQRAAKEADIHEFIQQLPQGYSTPVGERGVRLSGGQRQRIAIARALYRDPDVLILDEATSALDAETEERVLSKILDQSRGRTVIMVAHRKSAVMKCDRVYVVHEGRIVQAGRPGDRGVQDALATGGRSDVANDAGNDNRERDVILQASE